MSAQNPYDWARVEWIDSVGSGGWESPDEAKRDAAKETMRVWTVGFILEETDKYLLLCMSYMESGGSIHAPLQIPMASVTDIRRLALEDDS